MLRVFGSFIDEAGLVDLWIDLVDLEVVIVVGRNYYSRTYELKKCILTKTKTTTTTGNLNVQCMTYYETKASNVDQECKDVPYICIHIQIRTHFNLYTQTYLHTTQTQSRSHQTIPSFERVKGHCI